MSNTKDNSEGRNPKLEVTVRAAEVAVPDWWAVVPAGERTLIHAVVRMLRSAKRSELQEVAQAAAKWERGIGCFIKVRLMHEGPRKRRALLKIAPGERGVRLVETLTIACPSTGHSQPGGAPDRD